MKTRSIVLNKKRLLFNIDSITYAFSRTIDENNANASDAVATDQGEDYVKKTLERFMDGAIARLKQTITNYVKGVRDITGSWSSNTDDADFTLELKVIDEFKDSNLEAIRDSMYRYVVYSTVFDWYSTIGSANANQFAPESRGDIETIKRLMTDYDIPSITKS